MRSSSPEGILPLLEFVNDLRETPPAETRRQLERVTGARRVHPSVRNYASFLMARTMVRSGDVEGGFQRIRENGFVTSWRFIGPFDNEGKVGQRTAYPPEQNRTEAVDLAARYPGAERPVGWRMYPDISTYGYVDFDAVMRPYQNVCGYAETTVELDRAQDLGLWLGTGGTAKMWFNGAEIIEDDHYRSPGLDRFAVAVAGRRGLNRILIKSCITEQNWGFYLRVTDPRGQPLVLRADAANTDAVAVGGRSPVARNRLVAPLAYFQSRPRLESSATDTLRLAEYLSWSGAEDPELEPVVDLAERACTLRPSVDACLFAAARAEERSEKLRFLQTAEGVERGHPRVRLFRAAMIASGPEPERIEGLLRAFNEQTADGLRALLWRAETLAEYDFHETTDALIRRAEALAPEAQSVRRARLSWLSGQGDRDRQIELQRAILSDNFDDAGPRRALISDALERDEHDRVRGQLEALLAVNPASTSITTYAAAIYEAMGERDRAIAAYRQAVAQTPEEPDLHVSLGRALLRQQQDWAATASLRAALELRPQDAQTRRLLEQIRPAPRPDEAYAVDSDVILARRGEGDGQPATVLQDLRVVSVYENGLSSSFNQVAAHIHNDEGTRRWGSYSIAFEPDTQWVDIRMVRVTRRDGRVFREYRTGSRSLSDPRYRIYYNRRALVVSFPDLEPGDTVELRYRVDDVARRNVFDDYFGDLQILQRNEPVRRMEYVLLTPVSRQLYFNEPEVSGLSHQTSTDGNRRIHRFALENLPPLRPESGMPGVTELAPYIHVSTYANWEEVGRWWWGLIQDQLRLNDSIRETVEDLTRGVRDTQTKVERIYAWVLDNTRYVGLEFGIHGYKPYRITQVVRRGFGDCKDKASLLYAMLEHAGVDARIVLVRTRRNGAISERPASLSVFDHAIAYVPELDLYLDGTAEYNGTGELPTMDQGVTVLVVGPDDVSLRQTPVLPAAATFAENQYRMRLDASGDAEVEGTQRIGGALAQRIRSRYQAPGTRRERLQSSLAQDFPGIEIEEPTVRDLDDREAPARLEWQGRVPELAQGQGGTLRLRPNNMGSLTRGLARLARRRHPLDLQGRFRSQERRTIELPPSTQASVPDNSDLRSDFGTFRLEYQTQGRTVEIESQFELSQDRVTPEAYPAFRQWLEQVDEANRRWISIQPVQ
ncbi:MAG: DUF3857 domain-containing protein [Myxococcota bacterium]